MTRTTNFKGAPLGLGGKEIKPGDPLPPFKVTRNDMSDMDQTALAGKIAVILSVPSLDTPVCAKETKRFNEEAASLADNVVVLTVSRDLPFAQARYCAAEGVERALTASDYKHREFGERFGTLINDWQLLSRAVFVAGPDSVIRYAEYVPEVSEEPRYDAALRAIKDLS